MILSFIPDSIIYAGLFGVILSLIIATAQNKWECKVFFLLALRLAIGWQFLFEGLHKINSHLVGPTETNKPFSSELYFKVAPTAFGEVMRKKFEDPTAIIADRVKAKSDLKPADFKSMSIADQAALCPEAVVKEIDAISESVPAAVRKEAEADLAKAKKEHEKAIEADKDNKNKNENDETLAKATKASEEKSAKADSIAAERILAAKAKYAAWIYGTLPRDAKVKFVADPVPFSAPQRLEHISVVKNRIENELQIADEKRQDGLGLGNGVEVKRVSELRNDLVALETDLVKDAKAFSLELRKELLGGKEPPADTTKSQGKRIDEFTMWFIAVVGACILFGFCTRVSCVLAAGFLVMTYLSHPAFPWYSVPPNTEGNPLFINKNIIECIALLVLACYPTGRWLGFDAVLHRLFHSRHYLEMENRANT